MPIAHLGGNATAEEVAAALAAEGAVIVDRLAPECLMDRIRAELEPHLAATGTGPDTFSGRNTRRTGALIARSASARELVLHPLALAVTSRFLGHASNFQLHLTQAIAIGPDEPPQPLHRDQWAFDFFPFPKGYEVQCNTLWALTEFTDANGATRVVPGSNLADDGVVYQHGDTEPAAMERGSVLFYSGSVYHGGGPNRTDTSRIGINITYNVAWLRQEENQYLSVPIEIAASLPVDLLRLMGYDRGAYALGYMDDLRDPIEAVHPGGGTVGFGGAGSSTGKPGRALPFPGVEIEFRVAVPDDHDEFFAAFEEVVNGKEGFPLAPPLTEAAFAEYWFAHTSEVWVVRVDGDFAGGYYLKPNFVGRAAHIANAGYFLRAANRGGGLGRRMVEHSLVQGRRLGFDAMQFNLVFASNPARRMYRDLGFEEIGVIPSAVEGEDAVIYWRSLAVDGQ